MSIEETVTEEIKMTREEWEELRDLEGQEYLANSKRIRAFGEFMDAQLKILRDHIWANPEWDKAIMEGRLIDLPKLALASDGSAAPITVVDAEALLNEPERKTVFHDTVDDQIDWLAEYGDLLKADEIAYSLKVINEKSGGAPITLTPEDMEVGGDVLRELIRNKLKAAGAVA